MDGKLILGKDLDNWNDSLATRAPYDLSESDKTGPQFMTGNDLARSAKISSDWKNPVAVYAQAYNPLSKSMQFAESLVTGTADSLLNLPANTSNIVAQMIVESTGKYQPIIDVVSILSDKNKREQLKKAAAESQDSLNETIDLLIDRDYPVNRFAQRVIANATSTVENRKIVRELYKQAHGVDSSKWYNEAASIIGAMVPAMAAGNIAFKGARLFGAGRNAAIDIAKSIAKGYIGAEMAGQYAEETAAQYLERTGDKNFENFTAKDASGLMATAYGAIGAQIEFMGGVEPIMAGALSKVGLRASALKAAAKIGAGEATEELLQGLTETLFRKIDGTSDKTWADGFKESLQGAAWGLFIGGTLGTTAFYANRQNLVKGIKTAMPSISDSEATLVADAMLDTAGEVSSQDPTLRNNLRQKIAMIYRDADIDNKEEAIDSLTDLEYSLITMDAVDRGIELKDHELFAGEVNELGWFRAGIPDERRADIQAINDNISDLKKQLAELNKAEEKDWEKIEEIENKLAQANQYVLEKMSDLARDDESAVRRMLRKVESKYVKKQKKKKKSDVSDNVKETKTETADQHKSPLQVLGYQWSGVILTDKDGQTGHHAFADKDAALNFVEEAKKHGYADKDIQIVGFDEPTTSATITEPTVTEEDDAVEEAEKFENGTITSGTPENQTENIIQDYGEKIEGAKKDMYSSGETSAKKPEKSTIDKVMEKAPSHEEESRVFRDWLEQQDPEFVEMIKELRLPIVVFKTEQYKQQLREAYEKDPLLKLERSLIDVIYGWEELKPETLEKLGITPEYNFYFRTGKHTLQSLTPENVSAYLGGRTAIKFTYQKSTNGNYYLWGNKGNNGSWIPLIKFNSQEEMNAHKESHQQADLEKIYNEMTTYKPSKEKVIRERVGTDYRNNKNITEEEFAKQFGFRGVQFGNYEKNEKRQREINNSYDSFMDLANLLNLPSKTISLGGTLGIAFGARGSGSAMAHYEPDLKVINITRDAGAGALAHEWFHALDNYLANNLSQYANLAGGGWITKADNYYYYKVNQELADSLKEYIRAIKEEKDFQLRLRQLGQYWKRDWEVAARLFEQYVSFKIAEQNNINDYLASPQSYYTSASPYLTAEEASRVFPKLEAMLNNLKTREEENGNIVLFQPGYASMRGDLVGGALDADAFEGKGEGSSVWFWGNYLLADKNLDKEHYYNQFNRSRPNLTYDGKELNHFLLNSMGITFPETQNIITNRVGNLAITKDWLKKTLSTYLRNSESLYESRIKDVVKLVDFENLLSDEKYTEKEIRDVIKDIETILQGKGFTTGPLYKFPESTEEGKIQAKYFKDPKKKEFFETVYSKLFNVFGGESYLSSASSSFALELADLHSQRKSLKAIDNFDFDKLGGRTGLLFKGKDVEDLLDKIDMPFERWRVKDAIRPVIIDAIIKNKDVAKEINKIKEKPLFDEKKLKSDIDKLIAKKTKSESPAFVESIKSAFDMFLNSEDSGESAVRIMDKLGLTESEKEVVRDIVTDLKGEKYFVDKNNTWKPSISDVFFSVRAHKLFEQGLQRAKDLFKDAKNNDFLYKPNASMYSFDVPKDELFLSANTKLNKQTSFVKNALTDFIKDYVDTMPFLRDFISISGFNYDSARWLFDIDNKINGEFDEALLLDIANNMMTSYNLHGKTSAVENKLLDLMYRTIKGAATQTLGKKTTIQDVANEIDAAVITESPLVKSSNSKEYYEDIKTLGKILKDRLLKKFKPADLLEDVAPSLDVAGLSEKYTGKKMYDNIVGNIEIHPEIFNELKQDKSLGLTANAKSDEIVSKLLRKYGIAGGRYYGKRDKKGWVTFDRTPAIERLYQHRVSGAAPKTYRGAYIPLYRFILRANRMDASTLAHEIAHDWMEVNFKLYRSGKAGENFMRVWGALEKALGISEDAKSVPEQASEAFARAYEGWLLSNKDWTKFISVDDKDKEKIESLFKTYQNELRDIYNDISNPYFKNTWGKIGELKPELKAWFDRVVNITDLDVMVERGEMTEEEATKVKLNRAIDKVVQSTDDEETKQSLLTARTLNDTQRYEVEGGNKNSLQMRLSDLAKEIDENNFVLKGNKYNTHRDMLAVAEAADNFVKTRLEDALAIINGQMAEVEGLYKEDIYTALERLALENGDLDLIDELKGSEIANQLAKELGQRVAGFRNWKQSTDIDVVSAIQSLDNKFEDALKNKKAKEQFDSALDLFEKEIKNQDKTADKNVDSILKELECK